MRKENEAAIKLMGREGDKLIPVFKALNGETDFLNEKAKELGISLSKDDAQAAHEFMVQLRDLAAIALGLSVTIGKQVGPIILGVMRSIADWFVDNQGTVKAFGTVFTTVFSEILDAVNLLIGALQTAVPLFTLYLNAKGAYDAATPSEPSSDGVSKQNITPVKPIPLPGEGDNESSKLRAIRESEAAARREYESTTAKLKLELTNQTKDFNEYIQERKVALTKLKTDLEASIVATGNAIIAGRARANEKPEDFKARQANELDTNEQKAREIQSNFERENAQIDAESAREELARRKARAEAALNLQIQQNRSALARAKEAADARIQIEQNAIAEERRLAETGDKTNDDAAGSIVEHERTIIGAHRSFLELQKQFDDEEAKSREKSLAKQRDETGADVREREKYQVQLDALAITRASKKKEQDAAIQALDRELTEKEREWAEFRRKAREQDLAYQVRLGEQEISLHREQLRTLTEQLRFETEKGVTSYRDAGEKIFMAELALISEEIRLVDKRIAGATAAQRKLLEAEKKILTEQWNALATEKDRQVGHDATPSAGIPATTGEEGLKDISILQQRQATIAKYEQQINQLILEGEQEQNKELQTEGAARIVILQRQFDQEKVVLGMRYEEQVRQLKARKEILVKDVAAQKDNAAEIAANDRLLEALAKRHKSALDQLTRDETRAADALNPRSRRGLFGAIYTEAIDKYGSKIVGLVSIFKGALEQMGAASINFGTIASDSFLKAAQAGLAVLNSWILTGQTGPAILRRLTAEVLAQVAAQSVVKAIFELAEGYADLANLNFPGAANHFAAAELYGEVAVGAALAGRVVAGNSFNTQMNGPGAASGSATVNGSSNATITNDQGQVITHNRNQAQDSPTAKNPVHVIVDVHFKSSEAEVEKVVGTVLSRDGMAVVERAIGKSIVRNGPVRMRIKDTSND